MRLMCDAPPPSLPFAQGNLIPAFHHNYWIGFRATTTAPKSNFRYMDPYAGTFDSNAYSHWGIYTVRDCGLPAYLPHKCISCSCSCSCSCVLPTSECSGA
jgi:hypothetical protein